MAIRRLAVRPGGIGDCLLCFPAIEALQPDEVWVPEPVVPLIRFAKARSIGSVGLDLLGLPGVEPPPSLLGGLRSFDEVVSWYGANRVEFREALSAVVPRAVFHAALPPISGEEHAADFFARQVGALTPAFPRIDVEPLGDARVIVHPFSGSPKKNWPLPRFEQVAQELDALWAETPDGRAFDNLLDLARRLRAAPLYIGNDSGITHLAAACGTPTIALFGASDARVWAPRGQHVRVIDEGGLDRIGVERVLAEARRLLAR